ncbi:HNH endonuclease [Sulfurimonas sp.]|uniref:HNH endonuclease n=1 Tax=Sulfurimonas sp. TaxID=2022749 RepID=UPI0025CC0FE0|nr:HNH endonuclease [Sulfurimonas sp.]
MELNDNVLINVVDHTNQVVASSYIYFNSNTATNNPSETRDEYRLYITNEINTNRDLFKPDDIITFTKYKIEDEIYYKLTLFTAHENNAQYKLLKGALKEKQSGVRAVNHLLAEIDTFEFLRCDIEVSDEKTIFPAQTIDKMIENQTDIFNDLEKVAKEDKEVPEDETGLIKSNNFRDIVLFAYMGKCAITGKSITYSSLSNLEAAHIMPQAHNGPDAIPNGMALSRDLHWAFDKGFFTIENISDSYIVQVHDNVKENEVMKEIAGQKIFTPSDPRFRLHINALNYHKEHIYGTFKQIRSKP